MLLSGWATLVSEPALFNGEKVNSVEIALGKDNNEERVRFFVISKKGSMFSTEMLGRYEIHKLHDIVTENEERSSIRNWLMTNVEKDYLHSKINEEKQRFFSLYQYADSCKRKALIEFDDDSLNYTIGLKEFVTQEMLDDFYVSNSFKRNDEYQKCVGVSIK